jgi:hypothetical protein
MMWQAIVTDHRVSHHLDKETYEHLSHTCVTF